MYTIVTPKQFLRHANKFFRKRLDLKPRFAKLVSDLQHDPFQRRLEAHPLRGKLSGCHAVSLAHSYRITLTLHITENEIILLDIGSHDVVKAFKISLNQMHSI
ncbi:MAG: type II toxin-antitoxin system mRNA interferase toxin, RelE/StbE family [Nitrospinae bacterium]|nr:type II toxin-antitoxin system mRNA interferase toxin, RelE/StbE family [Nitrospinota bacterium]